jgi:signal transduction histidine kinase
MNTAVLPDESIAIGHQAAEIAAGALEELGREIIRQKAQDIARQIEIYLKHREFTSLDAIKHDAELAAIAVVKIGHSGYSAVHDTNAVNLFHPEPVVIGTDLHINESPFPQFWEIIKAGLRQEAGGYYDWPDGSGQVHRKYMYCVPIFPEQIAPIGLVVATTIFIDEFLSPSREIRQRIITLAERVDDFTRVEQRRNSQLRAINEFSRKISSFLNVQELLPYVAATLQKTFQIQSVRIFLMCGEPRGLVLAAQAGDIDCLAAPDTAEILSQEVIEQVRITGKPYLSSETPPSSLTEQSDTCTPMRMAVPIKIGKNIFGVLDLINANVQPFGDVDLFTIWPLTDQVAIGIENARLHTELREMAVIEERNRIAREIHDTLAQGFAGISMMVESAKMALNEQDLAQSEIILDRIRGLAKEKLSEARRSVQALRPDITIQGNLETLIRGELNQLEVDMRIETSLDVVGEEQSVSPGIKLALLRICQEALNNIKKHAQASEVHIALTYNKNAVALLVQDNGIGFNPHTPTSNNYGLTFMSERARLVGGSVIVNSEVGVGTNIYVNIAL